MQIRKKKINNKLNKLPNKFRDTFITIRYVLTNDINYNISESTGCFGCS